MSMRLHNRSAIPSPNNSGSGPDLLPLTKYTVSEKSGDEENSSKSHNKMQAFLASVLWIADNPLLFPDLQK